VATCYRHPSRETGVSCSNCGRPICPDCMTPTPVGMRCPECSKQTTNVRNVRAAYDSPPRVTIALIAVNVLIFFGMSTQGGFGSAGGSVFVDYALYGPAIADPFHEYYRLITGGFMHSGILHIAFNMYILWFLGRLLEPSLGPVRFAGLYFTALLSGSFGALLLKPESFTVGASGAVFGLMGAAFVMQRARGIDPMQSGIGPLILLNLAIGFLPGLNISIGGHLGGLVGGALAGLLMDRAPNRLPIQVGICLAVSAGAVAGALLVVQSHFS
jgi:membrane associated rhomboid family serine protease